MDNTLAWILALGLFVLSCNGVISVIEARRIHQELLKLDGAVTLKLHLLDEKLAELEEDVERESVLSVHERKKLVDSMRVIWEHDTELTHVKKHLPLESARIDVLGKSLNTFKEVFIQDMYDDDAADREKLSDRITKLEKE